MIELPEAITLARQLNETVIGRTIVYAEAGHSPHRFAWFTGDPAGYGVLLGGRKLLQARASGCFVELAMSGGLTLFLGDGVNLRLYKPGAKLPEKHQLMLKLDDGSVLAATIQMYGGMNCYPDDNPDNPYITGARAKPSPLSGAFDRKYFDGLLEGSSSSLAAKAFLATEQRVPGLGNGALQDILFRAAINPRRKMESLSAAEIDGLFSSVKGTLAEMAEKGGRDTETDLFGMLGGYTTTLSKNTVNTACPRCGGTIIKEAYMGGSVYYCPGCQKK
jgi:formamidopyrimidine-DNA glycosylase